METLTYVVIGVVLLISLFSLGLSGFGVYFNALRDVERERLRANDLIRGLERCENEKQELERELRKLRDEILARAKEPGGSKHEINVIQAGEGSNVGQASAGKDNSQDRT